MEKTCEFNCKEKCTWMGDECIHPEIVCFAKNNIVMPKISVMQPTVKNEDNTIPVASENVAKEEFCNCGFRHPSGCGCGDRCCNCDKLIYPLRDSSGRELPLENVALSRDPEDEHNIPKKDE